MNKANNLEPVSRRERCTKFNSTSNDFSDKIVSNFVSFIVPVSGGNHYKSVRFSRHVSDVHQPLFIVDRSDETIAAASDDERLIDLLKQRMFLPSESQNSSMLQGNAVKVTLIFGIPTRKSWFATHVQKCIHRNVFDVLQLFQINMK